VLLSAQSRAPGYKDAFAQLRKLNWYQLYGFFRHQGYSLQDAQDLVKGFFVHLVEYKTLSSVDRSKGEFRSFLLASFRGGRSRRGAASRASPCRPPDLAAAGTTTRLPVTDIADHEQTSALRCNLDQLSSDAGAKLLRTLGVKGHEAEETRLAARLFF